jgi:HlyD family secretion protein
MDAAITISANGTVQPAQSVNVSPKSSGVLKQLLVKEGDRVETGQLLAQMDDSNLQGQFLQAQAQVATAQANLDKLEAGNRPQEIAQARSQLAVAEASRQQAELNFNQNQRLFTAGALSQREFDTSRTALATARAQVEQAKQALSLQQVGNRPEDIDAARAQVLNAQGQLKTVQTQINDTQIRAPFGGVITRKFADPGSFVTPTTSSSDASSATSSSILALASTNQVVAKVSETSISKLKVGQRVTIEADAFPGKTFPGTVVQIANQSTVDQNVTNFEVKASIDDRQNNLQSGMNVNVEFNVGKIPNAIVVPTVAIVRQAEGTGVLLAAREQGRPRFQRITTGATVDDKTVVESGLKEGDRVLISFPQGERPQSRTPSVFPGAGGNRRGGG